MNTFAELPLERKWRLIRSAVATIGMLVALIIYVIFFVVKVFFS